MIGGKVLNGDIMKKLFIALMAFFATQAFSEVLYFGTNLSTTCAFSNATNGRFAQVGPRNLDALNVGTPASITVINNRAGAFKVSITQPSGWIQAPATVSATGFQVQPRVVGPNAGSGFSPNGSKIESVLRNQGMDVISVGLLFEEPTLTTLPTGEYSTSVTVLCETV